MPVEIELDSEKRIATSFCIIRKAKKLEKKYPKVVSSHALETFSVKEGADQCQREPLPFHKTFNSSVNEIKWY